MIAYVTLRLLMRFHIIIIKLWVVSLLFSLDGQGQQNKLTLLLETTCEVGGGWPGLRRTGASWSIHRCFMCVFVHFIRLSNTHWEWLPGWLTECDEEEDWGRCGSCCSRQAYLISNWFTCRCYRWRLLPIIIYSKHTQSLTRPAIERTDELIKARGGGGIELIVL